MEKTYKFELPQNKEVVKTNIRVEDGKVYVDVEFKEKFCPKDGDFIFYKGCDSHAVFVCKRVKKENTLGCFCGIQYFWDNTKTFNNYGSDNYTHLYGSRFATKDEVKKFLTDIEKDYHKKWNAKKKCLEDIFVPKFGDIVRVECPNNIHSRNYIICIFPDKVLPEKSVSKFFDIAVIDLAGCLRICDAGGYYNYGNVRLASKPEKQELFNKLAEVGKRWNETTKELEDIRWKPKEGETYYYVNGAGEVGEAQYFSEVDKSYLNINNCFKTETAAQPYADQIKEIFKNSKAE